MSRRAGAVLLLLAGACAPAERGVELQVTLKTSCGTSQTQWDFSCITAFVTRVIDAEGEEVASSCTPVEGLFANLNALITHPNVLRLLEDLAPMDGVRVELVGYHRQVSESLEPCEDPLPSERMVWGSSELVDLIDPSRVRVQIALECRPECHCGQLGTSCPLSLEAGICAGLPAAPCRHACIEGEDCYGGELYGMSCSSNFCAPMAAGGMCTACDGSAACDSGLCAECAATAQPSCPLPRERFCAQACPTGPDSGLPCPPEMSCKRLGAGDYELVTP